MILSLIFDILKSLNEKKVISITNNNIVNYSPSLWGKIKTLETLNEHVKDPEKHFNNSTYFKLMTPFFLSLCKGKYCNFF